MVVRRVYIAPACLDESVGAEFEESFMRDARRDSIVCWGKIRACLDSQY